VDRVWWIVDRGSCIVYRVSCIVNRGLWIVYGVETFYVKTGQIM
jgi:hypothetical protein